ncbi:solute carrier family 25 member 35 [Tetranychus urticae]|uniref:Solute carrier family 25 member 35 n=1 Tax=Tetranychus urticae TaxID=32264 RepID=T1KYQ5_TETUR|nr:solute carrier family 25 member 35 [Tetranychus urticae]
MADPVEFILGGLAAAGAGFFSNPLEVVKTRIQLQGELRSRGQYTVHYRNVFHAFRVIGKTEGLLSLQKGLVPAIYYQFSMNGVRLGVFQCIDNSGVTRNQQGKPIFGYTVLAGAISGAIGAAVGSPFYLIKTHLQAQANSSIAVGHQHKHGSFSEAFIKIFKTQGVTGLWRGSLASMTRVTVGSSAQLTTFSKFRSFFDNYPFLKSESLANTIAAAIFSSLAVVTMMTPFDVVSTRLYNQPVDTVTKKGLKYKGMFDCARKILQTEGPFGFYKGGIASYIRIGPHTILSLLFWREFRKLYFSINGESKDSKTVISS